MGEKGEGLSRKMYKGPMDKAKGEQNQGWEGGTGGAGEVVGVNGDNCN